jgi:putative ABC transport system permease protein
MQTPPSSLEAQVFARNIVVPDYSVFVPYTVAPDWSLNASVLVRGIDGIYVKSRSAAAIPRSLSAVTNLLMQMGINTDRLQWVTPSVLSTGLNRLKNMVQATAGGIGILALILGGVTLASLMLANVQDRVVEIGLRRAFGARSADIAKLFVLEALVVTGTASCLGTLAAAIALWLAGPLPLPASLSVFSLLAPVIFGLILGGFSAWWPARLAAHVEPAQALRQG